RGVARGGGHDAAAPLLRRQRGDEVRAPADLERSRGLPAFELQPGGPRAQAEGRAQRGGREMAGQDPVRAEDVLEVEARSDGQGRSGPPAARSSRGSPQRAAMAPATRSRNATTARHPSPCAATGAPIHSRIVRGRGSQAFSGSVARVPCSARGTTAAPACAAAWKAPSRNGRSPAVPVKVPSGKKRTESPCSSARATLPVSATPCRASQRSTVTCPAL